MSTNRHAGLTFSGSKTVLAVPYRLKGSTAQSADKCEIFLHIPKCGGTTLHFIMACCARFAHNEYTRYVIRDLNPPVFMRNGWTGAWTEARNSITAAVQLSEYISGHFPFGIDEFTNRDCTYITLLRDPVAREISSFNHHYQKGFIDGDSTLLQQMMEDRIIIDNPQVRMIAGVDRMTGPCTEETYQQAVNNLAAHFSLVGTVENSNDFLKSLLALNNWPAVAYVRTQVSAVKAIDSISNELSEKLYAYHAYDKRLHQYAKSKWVGWKANNIAGVRHLDSSDPVTCLPPDIHDKKQPLLLRAGQLELEQN